jgi:hypothetical protein
MVREFGETKMEAYLKVWLINLTESLNVKRSLSEVQIDECAMLIVQEFKNLTIADINLIFKDAKMGKYGELYESLSMAKVLGWFNDYFTKRMDESELINQRKAQSYKYPEKRNNGGKSFKEYLKND